MWKCYSWAQNFRRKVWQVWGSQLPAIRCRKTTLAKDIPLNIPLIHGITWSIVQYKPICCICWSPEGMGNRNNAKIRQMWDPTEKYRNRSSRWTQKLTRTSETTSKSRSDIISPFTWSVQTWWKSAVGMLSKSRLVLIVKKLWLHSSRPYPHFASPSPHWVDRVKNSWTLSPLYCKLNACNVAFSLQ